jgi:hypothetical protein
MVVCAALKLGYFGHVCARIFTVIEERIYDSTLEAGGHNSYNE